MKDVTSRPTFNRSLLGTLLAVLLTLGALMAGTSVAAAHDVVESTNPADGSTLASMPDSITMNMNNTPAAIGSQIQVLDTNGTNYADGAVQVVDHVVTEKVKSGAPKGAYTVKWRLVSSDGHPIEGTFAFTTTSGTEASAQPGSENRAAAGSAAPISTGAATAVPASNGPGFPWLVLVFGVVAVAIIVFLVVFARNRLRRED